jgi:hypothetical protein
MAKLQSLDPHRSMFVTRKPRRAGRRAPAEGSEWSSASAGASSALNAARRPGPIGTILAYSARRGGRIPFAANHVRSL